MGDINMRSYYEIKNDALRFIRLYHKSNPDRNELKKKLENLHKVVSCCSLTSQDMFILMSTFMMNIDRFKEATFQSFLLCCVSETTLEKKMACDLMEWLLEKYDDRKSEAKCVILIKWFYSMLKNNQIAVGDLEVFYVFLFKIAEIYSYLNVMCPLLFLLSSYDNTLAWMLESVEHWKAKNPQNRFLTMLSKKIKLNETKSQMSGDALVWPYPAGLPAMNKVLNMRHSQRHAQVSDLALNDILKSDSSGPSLALVPLAQIKTPDSFAHFFHIICLPHDIVSLLSSNLGVMKSILDSELEDQFISRLKVKLTDMFLSNERAHKESECRSMLCYVYLFQSFIQQGIDCVSNFLSLYLRNWNGLDYKEEILNLCEWFVFDSKVSLLNDFLAPLHTLLITADPDEKKLYLEMYGKLYTNLLMESDKLTNKNETRMFLSLEPSAAKCDWMRNEETSKDVFSFLSRVIMQESRMAVLYTPSHRDVLLHCTLDLCLKCLTAEECFNKPLLTMIPPCAVYLSLFSPSLRNISSVCYILDRYKQYLKSDRFYGFLNEFERESITIDGHIEDYINFLWRGTGWAERKMGIVFRSIESKEDVEPLLGRYLDAQLNNSLHCRNHVAIMTLAVTIMDNVGISSNSALTDEEFLNSILQSLCPNLVSFIKKYREDSDSIFC